MSGANLGRIHCTAQPISGNFEVVRVLIEDYHDPAFKFINAKDGAGWTPFARFIEHRKVVISKTVLSFDSCSSMAQI
jgi:hypothetical protein